MATNEIYKYGRWLSLPLPLRGTDPAVNNDPTRNGDPVLIGDIVGVAQEVGGVPVTYSVGTLTVTQSTNTANSLKPGWASVAMVGAFALPVSDFNPDIHGSGTTVNITAAAGVTPATLTVAAGSHMFGTIVGWTSTADGQLPIVNIVQSLTGVVNTVPDIAVGS